MKKTYKINLKNNSVAIYSPDNFNIKEGTNFLQESLQKIKNVERLINGSKMIVLMIDESCECTFHLSDENIDEKILNTYYSYLKRGVEVKNNTLIITDTRKLENYSLSDLGYKIELENGYYNVHIFSRFDTDVYMYFEKVDKKPKLNIIFGDSYEIITKKENNRILLSRNYNKFMMNNYSLITKEDVKNTFIKDKNNFIYNLGKLNLTSGKIAIFNPLSIDDMDNIIDEENILDREVRPGEYEVLLSMRKTEYGTYITGVKIVFSKKEVEKYELATTTAYNTTFSGTQGYSGIGDFESVEKYNDVFQSFTYLPTKENKIINDFNRNAEKNKNIINKYNYFMLWDIPTMSNNVALFNIGLGLDSYKAYYGLDKDDELVELVIPLIRTEIFKYKEYELKKNRVEIINEYIEEIRILIKDYISLVHKENKKTPLYIVIPENISCKIEEIFFYIIDLKLSSDAIPYVLKLLDDFPEIDFYTKSDAIYYLFIERYDCKTLLYETTNKEPTPYKIYLIAKYLYQTGISTVENKCLISLLKKLKRSNNKELKRQAKMRYKELINVKNKTIKKIYNIVFYITFIALIILYFLF